MKYSEPTNARFFAAVYRDNYGSGRDLQPTSGGISSAGVVLPKIPKKKERTGRPSKSLLVTQLQTLGQ